jgi:hypothetical protein
VEALIVEKLITAMALKMPQFRSPVLRVKIRYRRKRWLPKNSSRVSRLAQRQERERGAALRGVPMELSREDFASLMALRRNDVASRVV